MLREEFPHKETVLVVGLAQVFRVAGVDVVLLGATEVVRMG